jgi:hypothetical protein
MAEPDDEIEEHEELSAEQIAEDAGELFGAEDRSPPVGEAKAPPPPG